MKKLSKILLHVLFIAGYALILSAGMICCLFFLGCCAGAALDGKNVAEYYPIAFPLSIALGFVALAALIVLYIINLRLSKKMFYNKLVWIIQTIVAVALSIPMIYFWLKVYDIFWMLV